MLEADRQKALIVGRDKGGLKRQAGADHGRARPQVGEEIGRHVDGFDRLDQQIIAGVDYKNAVRVVIDIKNRLDLGRDAVVAHQARRTGLTVNGAQPQVDRGAFDAVDLVVVERFNQGLGSHAAVFLDLDACSNHFYDAVRA